MAVLDTIPDGRGGVLALLLIIFIFEMYVWWKDLIFYKRNGWDFSTDNPSQIIQIYYGDSSHDEDIVTNKDRVLFSLPLILVVILICTAAMLFV